MSGVSDWLFDAAESALAPTVCDDGGTIHELV